MTFIDIPYRLAVKATCTNRKCNISDFGGPTSGFAKFLWAHLIDHSRLVGGLCYDFYSYLQPFGRARQVSSDGAPLVPPYAFHELAYAVGELTMLRVIFCSLFTQVKLVGK